MTPEILEGCYNFLLTTRPFNRWGLPPADNVEFCVLRRKEFMLGDCVEASEGKYPRIRINSRYVVWTDNLMRVMAHEMVHLHLLRYDRRSNHGPRFKRCAAIVCKYHGFDPAMF